MTELELIEGCLKGKRESQRELYEKYSSKMLALCYRYAGDIDIAHDLLHDGFIQIFSSIGSYQAKGSFEGWMRRIFVTTSLGYLRKEKRFSDTVVEDMAIKSDDSDDSIIDKITDSEVLEVMKKMPDGYRTVINMYAIEGYSHKEIGAALGIEEASSRSQFLRAKKLLKKLLTGREI